MIIYTNAQDLFNKADSFHAEAVVDISHDDSSGTFTVSVTGVRGYCKYGWNFKQYINVWISNNKNGTDASSGYAEIKASGSNTYTGYMPKDGYQSISCSKTFNYNSDGSVPDVYVYVRSYNSNVKWLKNNVYVSASTHSTTNVRSYIPIRNNTPLRFNVTKTLEEPSKIGIKTQTQSGYSCSSWQLRLYSGTGIDYMPPNLDVFDKIEYGTSGINKQYTVANGKYHDLYVRGQNAVNGIWSDWVKTNYDCRLPTIYGLSITPITSKTASLKLNPDFECELYFGRKNKNLKYYGVVKSYSSQTVVVDVDPDVSNGEYVVRVKRTYNTNLSSERYVTCDTHIPVLTITNLNAAGNEINISVNSDVSCRDWTLYLNGYKVPVSPIPTADGKSIDVTLGGVAVGQEYNITVKAISNRNGVQGSVDGGPVLCVGFVHIQTDNGSEKCIVHIFNGKKWMAAIPYVYDGTEWKHAT